MIHELNFWMVPDIYLSQIEALYAELGFLSNKHTFKNTSGHIFLFQGFLRNQGLVLF